MQGTQQFYSISF